MLPPRHPFGENAVSFSRSRLKRAEAAAGGGSCSGCRLRPQEGGYIVVDGNDPVPQMPEVCPECGRYTRLHIVVVEEGEGGLLGEHM